MTDTWYSPGAIKFEEYHIRWLIQNLPTLEAGEWPRQFRKPDGMSEDNMPNTSGHAYKNAKFTRPVEYSAEVKRRLESCGLDGLMLLLREWGRPDYEIARYYRIPVERVPMICEAVMNHITGWNFKSGQYRRDHALISVERAKEKGIPSPLRQ